MVCGDDQLVGQPMSRIRWDLSPASSYGLRSSRRTVCTIARGSSVAGPGRAPPKPASLKWKCVEPPTQTSSRRVVLPRPAVLTTDCRQGECPACGTQTLNSTFRIVTALPGLPGCPVPPVASTDVELASRPQFIARFLSSPLSRRLSAPCDMTAIRSIGYQCPACQAVSLSLSHSSGSICAALEWEFGEMMWSVVPFCHSAGTAIVAWGIWHGHLVQGIVERASPTDLWPDRS
jgi:hypothetical protein